MTFLAKFVKNYSHYEICDHDVFFFMKNFFTITSPSDIWCSWKFWKIFQPWRFRKKNDIFQKKKVTVVKNHINWKSDKFSSTMTLRKKTSWLVKTRNKWLFDKFQPNHDVFGKICKKLFALWNLWSWCFFFSWKIFPPLHLRLKFNVRGNFEKFSNHDVFEKNDIFQKKSHGCEKPY